MATPKRPAPSTPTRTPPPFSVFFAEQAPGVARLLAALVPRGEVEELVQETFLAALRGYDDFDGRSPRGWVLAIARRKAIDAHRSRGRRPAGASIEELDVAAPADASAIDGVWSEVAALPEKQRAALVLRFALDMPHREIGEALGCSEAAARRSVHEGVAKLRSNEAARVKEAPG